MVLGSRGSHGIAAAFTPANPDLEAQVATQTVSHGGTTSKQNMRVATVGQPPQ